MAIMTLLEMDLDGVPRPQGSKTGGVVYRKDSGLVCRPDGRPVVVVRESCKGLAEWRRYVRDEAKKQAPAEPYAGPVEVYCTFWWPRPKSHFGTGRNEHVLKANAPPCPIGRPDLSKLLRAIEDALTGVIWCDDSQVVAQTALKSYGAYQKWITRVTVRKY